MNINLYYGNICPICKLQLEYGFYKFIIYNNCNNCGKYDIEYDIEKGEYVYTIENQVWTWNNNNSETAVQKLKREIEIKVTIDRLTISY